MLKWLCIYCLYCVFAGPVFAYPCHVPQDARHSGFNGVLEQIRIGHPDAGFKALESGISVNTRNSCGASMLLVAAGHGQLSLVHELINRGANVNVQNWAGMTPLAAAAMLGHKEVVEALLRSGAHPNEKLFGKDVALNTALSLAAANDHREIVELLLTNGADPCIRNREGKTILDYAVTMKLESGIRKRLEGAADGGCTFSISVR